MELLNPIDACSRMLPALEGRAGDITPPEMAQRLVGWEFIDVSGAVVMRRGAELHAAAPFDVRGKWITRRNMRAVLLDTLARFGRVVTSVTLANAAGHAFVRRLGFVESGRNDHSTAYVLTECRHV